MFKGEKVELRPVKRSDISHFLVWFNDPEVTRYLSLVWPMTEMAEEKWMEDQVQDRSQLYLVIEALRPEGNLVIGNTGFNRISPVERQAVFGIVIGDKDYWNNGYGTEAAALLMRYGFDYLNLHRVSSDVYDFNTRSQRLHQKLGFREEGRRREAKFVEGAYHDVLEYGLLRSDWLTGQAG